MVLESRGVRGWLGRVQAGPRLPRAVRLDLLLLAVILGVLWTAIATWCVLGYRNNVAMVQRVSGSLAGASEQAMLRTVEAMDQRLIYLRQVFRRDPAAFDLSFLAEDNGYKDRLMMQAAFIDEVGLLRQTSLGHTDGTLSLADRPHFLAHLNTPDDALYISAPVLGRVSQKWSVQFTRKVFAPDGRFAGVLVGSLDPAWMMQLQASLDVQGSLQLIGDDGVVRASAPDFTQIGRNLSPGQLAALQSAGVPSGSVQDGTTVLRHLPNYPLSVLVSVDGAALFAGYWRALLVMIGLGVGITAAVVLAGLVLLHFRVRAASAQAALGGAIENIDQGLVMLDGNGRLSVCNERFSTLLQLPPGIAVPGADLRPLLALGRAERERPRADAAAVEERFLPDGSVLEIRTRGLPDGGQVRTYTDVTERWEAEERIFFLAHHDGLTGLANRFTLRDHLQQAMALAREDGELIAVLCLDLDRFKHVNDSMGHPMGDELLKQVADRLRHLTRESGIIARSGGDEFIVVQTQLPGRMEALQVAERIRHAMRIPFVLERREIIIGTSIGIALFPGEAETLDGLLKNADTALYRAKSDGRGSIRFFEPAMEESARERADLEQDLRVALAERAFQLYFQPLFAADAETIVAYEALLRWEHPVRGMISPASFIPVAEECGLILPLGRWVLEEACRAAVGWPNSCVVAVNLSPIQIQRGDVPALVETVLRETGLDPARLEIEITEGVLIQDADAALATLTALKALGVSLVLDDFGTGYSSLSYLSRFPFDKLKIDKSFTRGLGLNEEERVIVEAIIALGKSLGLRVTAEGVETEAQLQFLRCRGCDEFQGFLLGVPRPGVALQLQPAVLVAG
jgi:diguanylate cyclase (GGDEF)-like protein